jgi:lysophospholipase-2
MNMGMRMPSWYDIVGLDERANENCKGITESRATIEQILQQEHTDTGLPYTRMVLAGFSQGGALSLFTGLQLQHDQKLAGVVVLSGYLPAASQFKVTPGFEDVPVWHGHGTQDMLVRPDLAEKSRAAVTAQGVQSYSIHTYPCAHTVMMEEIRDMMTFLKQILPPDDSCKITLKDPSTMSIKELKAAIRKAGLQSQARGFTEKKEFIDLLTNHRNGKL